MVAVRASLLHEIHWSRCWWRVSSSGEFELRGTYSPVTRKGGISESLTPTFNHRASWKHGNLLLRSALCECTVDAHIGASRLEKALPAGVALHVKTPLYSMAGHVHGRFAFVDGLPGKECGCIPWRDLRISSQSRSCRHSGCGSLQGRRAA